MFTAMFPLTFLANTFVPTEGMPTWLRTVAEWNPVSSLILAARKFGATWSGAGRRSPASPVSGPLHDRLGGGDHGGGGAARAADVPEAHPGLSRGPDQLGPVTLI